VIRVNKFNDITKNRLDEWIYFLKNEMIKDDFKAKGLDKAQKTLDIMKLKDEDRRAYNRKLDNLSLEKSLIRSAEIEAEERGRQDGNKSAKIEIAKSLLDILDIEIISSKTGLSVEEIERLK
jgi:predicted transposase/invertase (TIGR01784 family)